MPKTLTIPTVALLPIVALPLVALVANAALAATTASGSGVTLDLTGISTAVIAGVFSVLAIVLPLLISAHVKNAADRVALGNAVKYSVGNLEATTAALAVQLQPHVTIPGVPSQLQIPVQYVLDHAGDEAARLKITPVKIAGKINTQWGLTKLVAKQAAEALSALPTPVIVPIAPALVQ